MCPSRLILVVGLACSLALACQPMPQAPASAVGPPPVTAKQSATEIRRHALERDPEPTDEGLRDLIAELKDRFRCNAISGCPVQARLTAYGWAARVPLEGLFARAGWQTPYRARTVQIIKELGDPGAEPFLAHCLEDRDPEVRAQGALGLASLGASKYTQRLQELRHADQPWQAPAKVGALYALWQLGDEAAGAEFSVTLQALAPLHMAGGALTLGAELCARVPAPDCRAALPAIARHPGFQARRAALHAMTARLHPSYAPALVYLLGDQARSIRDEAEAALVALTGDQSRNGKDEWLAWCQSGGCKALLPGP